MSSGVWREEGGRREGTRSEQLLRRQDPHRELSTSRTRQCAGWPGTLSPLQREAAGNPKQSSSRVGAAAGVRAHACCRPTQGLGITHMADRSRMLAPQQSPLPRNEVEGLTPPSSTSLPASLALISLPQRSHLQTGRCMRAPGKLWRPSFLLRVVLEETGGEMGSATAMGAGAGNLGAWRVGVESD